MVIFKDAIREIFGQYGQITAIFHPPKATWSYVSYGSYREAELAIRELNNKKPLYLQIALAKQRFSRKEEQLGEIPQVRRVVTDSVTEPNFATRDLPMKP